MVRSSEECDDGNGRNGDGCSSICEIEDREEVEEIIKEKKITKVITRKPTLTPIVLLLPQILAPTGYADRERLLQAVLQAYEAGK